MQVWTIHLGFDIRQILPPPLNRVPAPPYSTL